MNPADSCVRTPSILAFAPRDPRARRLAETAWSLYPPIALLLAVFVLAGGCRKEADDAAMTRRDDAGITEPGNAQGLQMARAARATGLQNESAISTEAPADAPAGIVYPSYPADSELVGTAAARAIVMYGKNRIELGNLSSQPWTETRIWVNRRYSLLLPHTKAGQIRTIRFDVLRDENGRHFPTNNMKIRVEEIELVTGDERATVRWGLGF